MKISKTSALSTCLFVSLVGNVMLGGMLAGKHVKYEKAASPSLRGVARLMKDLPPEQSKRLGPILDSAQNGLTEKYKSLDIERQHIAELMAAPQVDKQALDDAFAFYRATVNDVEVISQKALVDSAMLLSQNDRVRISEAPSRHRKAKSKSEAPEAQSPPAAAAPLPQTPAPNPKP